MKLKYKVKISKKEFIVSELTVELYLLFLTDFNEFIENLFLEFNKEVPRMNGKQISLFLEEYFEVKENIKRKINKSNKEMKELLLINIGKFVRFFEGGIGYESVLKMSFNTFIFLFDNLEVIAGEKNFIFSENRKKEDRKKLRDLFNNQK